MEQEDVKKSVVGYVIIGLVIIGIGFLFWLDSYNRLSPEEKAQVERRSQTFKNELEYCNRILNNNQYGQEYERCYSMMEDLVSDVNNSRP